MPVVAAAECGWELKAGLRAGLPGCGLAWFVGREEAADRPFKHPCRSPSALWEGGGGSLQTGWWVCSPWGGGWRSCGTHRKGGREEGWRGGAGELWPGCHSCAGFPSPVPLRKVGEGGAASGGLGACWWGELRERGGRTCAPPFAVAHSALAPWERGLDCPGFGAEGRGDVLGEPAGSGPVKTKGPPSSG